jgi:hypothetical protein
MNLGPTNYIATAATDYNTNSSAVFKMIFAAGTQLHGATGVFLFSNVTNAWPGANNETIAKILSDYFLSFTMTLDPNSLRSANAPFWPSYIDGAPGNASIGEDVGFTILDIAYSSISTKMDPDIRPQCDFWAAQPFFI